MSFCAAAVLVIFYRAKAIPAVFVALLIGFSRIYLCEHYVSDVAAGIIIGSLCGVAGYYIYRAVERAVLRAYDKNRYRLKARAFRTRLPKRYRENIFY